MRLLFNIAISYLAKRKRQSFLCVLGVMLGVAFFIGISAMMMGFQDYFISQIIDVSPHIVMKDEFRTPALQPAESLYGDSAAIEIRGLKPKQELRGIRNAERIMSSIAEIKGVLVAPALESQAFIRYGSKDLSTAITGIEPEKERMVSNIEKDIKDGSLNNLMTNSNGIILGAGLAKKLGAKVGAKLSVISPAGVIMNMKVVGLADTGITSIDMTTSYAWLKKVQVLQERPNVINRLKMRLANIDLAQTIAKNIEQQYGYRTESWQETNQNIFGLFKVQNGIMYSTVGAILIVSGFGIFNIISTVVREKEKDIAILKSIGFSSHDIEIIYIFQGLIVGLIGMIAGWILGWLIIDMLKHVDFKMEDEGFVRVQGFVLLVTVWQFMVGGVLALLSAILSSYFPARKAAALKPVDIIRGAS